MGGRLMARCYKNKALGTPLSQWVFCQRRPDAEWTILLCIEGSLGQIMRHFNRVVG